MLAIKKHLTLSNLLLVITVIFTLFMPLAYKSSDPRHVAIIMTSVSGLLTILSITFLFKVNKLFLFIQTLLMGSVIGIFGLEDGHSLKIAAIVFGCLFWSEIIFLIVITVKKNLLNIKNLPESKGEYIYLPMLLLTLFGTLGLGIMIISLNLSYFYFYIGIAWLHLCLLLRRLVL